MPAQPLQAQPSGPNRLLCSESDKVYGDFRDDLSRDGYAIIKGAIPRERADKYADEMYSWLEGLYAISPSLSPHHQPSHPPQPPLSNAFPATSASTATTPAPCTSGTCHTSPKKA